MFKKVCLLFLIMAASVCFGAAAANAAPIIFFDDLGTTYTGSYSPYGWSTTAWAGAFTPSSSGTVTEIDLEIARRYEDTSYYSGAFKVEVWGSSANIPGTKLYGSTEQTASAVYPNSIVGYNPETALQSIGVTGLNLTAGQSYFLVVVASQPTSDLVWWASSSTSGTIDQLNSAWSVYSTNTYEPAFKITGEQSVPIPSAAWLLASGIPGLGFLRRRFIRA